jgi:hypothetical protein
MALGDFSGSGSLKVGARKIGRCHFQVPVLKVRSQFRSQLKFLQGANFFEPKQWMIGGGITICVVLDQNHGNVMFYQLVSNLQSIFPSYEVFIAFQSPLLTNKEK